MQNGQSYKRHKMIKEKDKNSRNETNVKTTPNSQKPDGKNPTEIKWLTIQKPKKETNTEIYKLAKEQKTTSKNIQTNIFYRHA